MTTLASTLLKLADVECHNKESVDILTSVMKEVLEHDKKQQERLKKLQALEAAGVDNWEGYDVAMRQLYNDEEDDC